MTGSTLELSFDDVGIPRIRRSQQAALVLFEGELHAKAHGSVPEIRDHDDLLYRSARPSSGARSRSRRRVGHAGGRSQMSSAGGKLAVLSGSDSGRQRFCSNLCPQRFCHRARGLRQVEFFEQGDSPCCEGCRSGISQRKGLRCNAIADLTHCRNTCRREGRNAPQTQRCIAQQIRLRERHMGERQCNFSVARPALTVILWEYARS